MGANQHFVLVEVHRPDSEPDVNEVRALPQTRSECGCPALGTGRGLLSLESLVLLGLPALGPAEWSASPQEV